MYKDRIDAGQQLGRALRHYQSENTLVLAIPRGGVPVGFEVAKCIQADFSLVIACKLPFPENPEASFGAIAEDDSIVILKGADQNLAPKVIQDVINQQKSEIQRRIKILRGGRPLPNFQSKHVVVVDEGISMGAKMCAVINLCKKKNAKKIIIAAPVGSPEVANALNKMKAVADVIILDTPKFFRSVAQSYDHWYGVPDHEVLAIMNQWHKKHA